MTQRKPGAEGPGGLDPARDLLPGIAALYAAAADFDESCSFLSIPRGAALGLLERVVAADPVALAARELLEELRQAAGVERDHASWPLDVVEAARALDEILDRPEATSVAEVLGDREYPWEYLVGLAQDRLRRGAGDAGRLRRAMELLRPRVAAEADPGAGAPALRSAAR